jgi:hypothetical protein
LLAAPRKIFPEVKFLGLEALFITPGKEIPLDLQRGRDLAKI